MTAEQGANVGEKAISGAERGGDKLKKRDDEPINSDSA
jgi:hypothetical protein